MHVLTIRTKDGYTEIHMLNPRQCMPGFGGSRTGLVVGKTASLVTRDFYGYCHRDTEHDIHSANVWEWIARLINAAEGEVKAELPSGEG